MATLQEFVTRIATDIPDMVGYFEGVATQDPLSAASLVMGSVFVVAASAVLGYLAFGGLLDVLGANPTR